MSNNVKIMKGDIFGYCEQGVFDAIVHGCNCFHNMGSGVAGILNSITQGVILEPDYETPYGDINKLGTYSVLKGWKFNKHSVDIYNLYTQHSFGRNGVHVHWESFYKGLFRICEERQVGKIGMPLIGCGLAGGEKDDFTDRVYSIAQFFPNIKFYIIEL